MFLHNLNIESAPSCRAQTAAETNESVEERCVSNANIDDSGGGVNVSAALRHSVHLREIL